VFEQAVQIFGAVLILLAYALATIGRLEQKSLAYILLNVAGSAILAALAAIERQFGFLVLEGAWAMISAWSLVSLGARVDPPPARVSRFQI
jgi:hypothetical protein